MTTDPLLGLYMQELSAIRTDARAFATAHRSEAGHLDSFDNDPFVERLLEGFAFMTARVQLKMEAQFPRFTDHLLEMVQPDLLAPMPATTIVQFEADQQAPGLAVGHLLKAGQTIVHPPNRRDISFITAHDVTLHPLELIGASYGPPPAGSGAEGATAALSLTLRCTGGLSSDALALDDLTVHLAEETRQFALLEQLLADAVAVLVRAPGAAGGTRLPADSIRPVGFDTADAMLPATGRAFDGLRLLREYFALPARFCFVRFTDLRRALAGIGGDRFEIVVLLRRRDGGLDGQVRANDLALFCTPAVNLFGQISRTILLKQGAQAHEITAEPGGGPLIIHSVRKVSGHSDGIGAGDFHPLFGGAILQGPAPRRFYTLARRPTVVGDTIGGRLFITLVDRDHAPLHPDEKALRVHLLCANADAATVSQRHDRFLPGGRSWPVKTIRRIGRVTEPGPAPVDVALPPGSDGWAGGGMRSAWPLIAHLSRGYLGLDDGSGQPPVEGLKALLSRLRPALDTVGEQRINDIRDFRMVPSHAVFPGPGPLTWVRGMSMELDMTGPPAAAYLLAAVVERLLHRQAAVNSFIQLALRRDSREEIVKWPLRTGQRPLI